MSNSFVIYYYSIVIYYILHTITYMAGDVIT